MKKIYLSILLILTSILSFSDLTQNEILEINRDAKKMLKVNKIKTEVIKTPFNLDIRYRKISSYAGKKTNVFSKEYSYYSFYTMLNDKYIPSFKSEIVFKNDKKMKLKLKLKEAGKKGDSK